MFNKKIEKSNKAERLTINEWQEIFGIKLKNLDGFRRPKNKVHTNLYTEKAFKRGVKGCYISCKTEKGLEFLSSI